MKPIARPSDLVRPAIRVLVCLVLACAGAAQDVDVTGSWDISLETGQGTATPSMVLRQDGENLSGSYKGRLGETKLEGKVKDRTIRFTLTLKFQEQPVTVTYDGTVAGDTMKGSVTFGDRFTANWTAKRRS